MPKLALVTGATSGIGAAFARQLAARSYDLILVARDEPRLRAYAAELAEGHGVSAEAIAADLSTEAGMDAVVRPLTDLTRPVDLLVNNAGLSLNKSFVRSTIDDEERLLAVNVRAVMRLAHAVIPAMLSRGSGAVINVSSVSGFGAVMPGSTYPASKAWVTNFSESLNLAVRGTGVRVQALCPGYTRTEFHARQGIDTSKFPRWMWLDADAVALHSLRDLGKGKAVSVPNWKYKIAVFGLRHLPKGLTQKASRDTRGRIGRTAEGDRA
jgi:short-subunit dehydrogenase